MSMPDKPGDESKRTANNADKANSGMSRAGVYDRPAQGFKLNPLLILIVLIVLALVIYLLFLR